MTPVSVWVERLQLRNFRSYGSCDLTLEPRPIVLTGPNGAGKTNLLEAVSLLAPGPGLRRAAYADMTRAGSSDAWIVSALVHNPEGSVRIGTTATRRGPEGDAAGRVVRINGENAQPAALAEHLEILWLTPAMDGLFTGSAGDRRRFLDRLIAGFDPGYRTRLGHFERAMRQRNRLLEDLAAPAAELEGLELQMAETGVAIAASRIEATEQLRATIEARRAAAPASPFPWAEIALEGRIESLLPGIPAVDAEDAYARLLRQGRARDRAAGRTLEGPHLCDLAVTHGPKQLAARLCSTGEQKALLINLILGQAELVTRRRHGAAPLLLLDEIAAHLDQQRREALFGELLDKGLQAWLTGTDRAPFSPLKSSAQCLEIGPEILPV